jgi:hypothetical protein
MTVKTNPPVGKTYNSTPPDALSLVLEQMALISARRDAQVTKTAPMRQRDTLRDAPYVHAQPPV